MPLLARLAAFSVVLALATASPLQTVHAQDVSNARDTCTDGYVTKRTTEGRRVWIPSSRSAGPFQFGGTQSIAVSDGELTARTKGTADTVGGTGGVNVGIVQASATYNRQWNRSTTRTTSFSKTFTTTSPQMPRTVNWRWRMYVLGYRFIVTKKWRIPTPCVNADEWTIKRKIIVPKRGTTNTFHVEKYSQRNWLLNMRGEPIRR